MQQYRVGDRVNSVHGPGDVLLWDVVLAADCSEEMLRKHVVNDLGQVVFAATVVDVFVDGALCLHYDDYAERGVEPAGAVRPRIQMPWHPRFLKDSFILLLRRNMGHGRVLEGLEVRWAYVSRLMQALTKLGHWRMETSLAPMHKHYDPRLFDVLS